MSLRLTLLTACFAILAAEAAFAKPPSNQQIAWRFAEAVRDDGDVTLAGAIPLTAEQATKLQVLKGCKFRRMGVSTKNRSIFYWNCNRGSAGDQMLTDVIFQGDRVLRVAMSRAIVR